MTAGQLLIEQDVSVQAALARGAALPKVLSVEQPIALYGASLRDAALVLGSYQLASQVLGGPLREHTLRRCSGGPSVYAGAGIVYVALALRERSSLMHCPPGRLLNRNVRGVLAGLRQLGTRANYFGREFLSFGAEPAAFVAWDAALDGSVVCEFFISQARPCFVPENELAYPPRREPALRGHASTTLQALGVAATPGQVVTAIAEGHAKSFGVIWQDTAASALSPHEVELASSSDTTEERQLHWSSPREEAIGFVTAGVALDGAGKLAAVRLAGDFFAHRGCAATLERVLLGVTPTPEHVARAVDTAFAHTGHDVEGIRNLRTFQDAIIDAADAAGTVLEQHARVERAKARE